MTDIRNSQSFVNVVVGGPSGGTRVSQSNITSIINFPTELVQLSNTFITALTQGDSDTLDVSQSFINVVAQGRIDDPSVRVWTYTLDQHDMVIFRLGEIETLVYDTLTGSWYTWADGNTEIWRTRTGINWIGSGVLGSRFGSNIVCGDDLNGTLYFLDPQKIFDDDNLLGDQEPQSFTRVVYGQHVVKGYNRDSINSIELLGSVGKTLNNSFIDISLSGSDDRGNTFQNYGTLSITPNTTNFRVNWRSLGSVEAPGRLFKIEDTGALTRIDSFTLYNDE